MAQAESIEPGVHQAGGVVFFEPQLRLGKDLSGECFKLGGVRVYLLAGARLSSSGFAVTALR